MKKQGMYISRHPRNTTVHCGHDQDDPRTIDIPLVIILLVFYFLGHSIPDTDHTDKGDKIVTTLVFNTFVFAQIFNSINCRRLDNRLNIFEGILKNRYFIVITLISTSLVSVFWSILNLMMIYRNRWSGPDRFRWWCRIPSYSDAQS